ncbi:cyanophycinase [Pedobacter sp. MC2016-05]|jgi:cyanophycinase|uniref:cyanophycinase n=1 Tax=Pedobacter sp. MC2016-05 TaxID=2994474 RepID=UPI00121EA702|nr:cyanophycinase [Pedobacter sp. MC2016-05]MCX2475869.1 cyanophycinase [Pedobacter sp. MC2016-05]RZK68210.1 MAG: cyanophycinase [Pedobacter sp.]
MKKLFLIFALVGFSLMLNAQSKATKGNLFIIGGGNRSDELMKQMLNTAELKPSDYIVVLPMASEVPDVGFGTLSAQLQKLDPRVIKNFNFAEHDVNDKKWTDSLSSAKLIYILGGDQSRFMNVVLNTPVYTAIHKAYQNGATIAGTSAGAAVMSKYMITGKQLLDTVYKETFNKLWDKNIEFLPGMGLLENTIIDQHFLKRNRYNRLISALAAHPDLVCVGIDESTAIIVHGNKATVAGESQVVRLANPKELKKTDKGLMKFKQSEFGIFTAGDVIKIKP